MVNDQKFAKAFENLELNSIYCGRMLRTVSTKKRIHLSLTQMNTQLCKHSYAGVTRTRFAQQDPKQARTKKRHAECSFVLTFTEKRSLGDVAALNAHGSQKSHKANDFFMKKLAKYRKVVSRPLGLWALTEQYAPFRSSRPRQLSPNGSSR